MPRIAFATYRGLPALSADDRLALGPLAALGIAVTAAAWDDAEVDWRTFDALIVRSTWNYHVHAAAFDRWLDQLESARLLVWNPVSVLRWNADKRYLRALESRGVSIVPTRWAGAGDGTSLGELLRDASWEDAVVKPTISASGHETWRVSGAPTADEEARFAAALERGGIMVQRFMPEVSGEGEWSFCFIDGAFSHAVRKRAAPGDFRVQEEHGGSTCAVAAPAALVVQAARALADADAPTLYARVDGCVVDGRLVLMELELVEPSLFLAHDPAAATRFAAAVARAVTR